MAFFDLSQEELKKFKPSIKEPRDFDLFWKTTIEASEAEKPAAIKLTPYDVDFPIIDIFDAEFPGFMGHPIKGWLLIPKNIRGPLPTVVEYIGYGGGRGLPIDWLGWVIKGYVYFVMDSRGQGTTWRTGNTPDKGDYHMGPELPGFMTRGIQHQDNYYYRRLICDAYRAVDAVKNLDIVDQSRIAVTGASQGGALALSVAGLRKDIIAAMVDVPFLCYFERAITLIDSDPYKEIASYLQRYRHHEKKVLGVLNYFDGCHFAKRAKAPALFSVALMDTICPPSTVYAAYNHYKGKKDIIVYPYNNHEGGENFQHMEKLGFLDKVLNP